jgi:ATP-dependent protease ClpP protease subunit
MDGFAIYNLLQSLPYEVHTHNIGAIQSIANVVFLAGDRRTAAPESSFMLHGFTWAFGQETLDEMQITERTGHISTARAEFE